MSEVLLALFTPFNDGGAAEQRSNGATEQRSNGATERAGMHDFRLRRPHRRALRDRWQGETGPGPIAGTVEPR